MKIFFFCLILILNVYESIAQIIVGGDSGSEFGDPKRFEKWIVTNKTDYQGAYHFGFSEGESQFFLIVEGDSCYAFIKYGEFIDGEHGFQWHSISLSKIKIDGNKFFSDQTQGEFVIYDWGTRKSTGLIVHKPWRQDVKPGISEFGFLTSKLDGYFNGKYPFSSYRFLTEDELYKITSSDLRIMRNEIYARQGYKFNPDGEMDIYFRKQNWYKPRFDNVDHSLTEIEKINVQTILKIEKINNGL